MEIWIVTQGTRCHNGKIMMVTGSRLKAAEKARGLVDARLSMHVVEVADPSSCCRWHNDSEFVEMKAWVVKLDPEFATLEDEPNRPRPEQLETARKEALEACLAFSYAQGHLTNALQSIRKAGQELST